MLPRSPDEEHRSATELELFFDLCFVVAIALAASNLHHEIAEGHAADGVLGYAMVFFAIWWAWMNFTWFASAYDTDDGLFRITTFVQMSGALILAAGVPRAFEDTDIGLMTAGYVVMRLAMVAQWLRAARMDEAHRVTALRYAMGISVMQAMWIGRLALPEHALVPSIFPLIAGELLVPVWAERARMTTWHPGHIGERYGLFTIIVLGESILASTVALQATLDAGNTSFMMVSAAFGGMVVVFAMWWLYFGEHVNRLLGSYWGTFAFGYGHLFIFAAAAAVGAGMEVVVDHESGVAHLSHVAVGLAFTVPLAVFLIGVWLLKILPAETGPILVAFPVSAALLVAVGLLGAPVQTSALVLAVLVVIMVSSQRAHIAARHAEEAV